MTLVRTSAFGSTPGLQMRILLQITAVSLVSCVLMLLASHGQVASPQATGLTSPSETPIEAKRRSDSESRTGIRTIKLPEGRGNLSLLRPGYLIITSLSRNSPPSTLRISRTELAGERPFRWKLLTPLKTSADRAPLPADVTSTAQGPPDDQSNSAKTETASQRTFFLHVTDGPLNDPRQYVPVHGLLLEEGDQVRIYLDADRPPSARVTDLARRIIDTLERQILPQASREVGRWDDVDGDGKLAVLLTPWLGKLQDGRTSLKGFVRGSDFRPHYPSPFGNQADVIYFNSELTSGTDLLTLLAHEYWHVLQCSYRVSKPESPLPTEEDWINEGTAHLAELRFGGSSGNLDHRIRAWLAAPEAAPLVVENYYSAGLWRDDGCRGATFLFFKWCQDRYGTNLARRLLTATASGARNLEDVTGSDLETLQVHWAVSMLEQSRASHTSVDEKLTAAMFAGTPGFEQITLKELHVHTLGDVELDEPYAVKLAPSASCYLRINSGDWNIVGESAEALRVTWIPEQPSPQFVKQHSPGDQARR